MTALGNQNWRTPPTVFSCLSATFGPFVCDFSADKSNKLCHSWSSNCLVDPFPRGKIFCNPPWKLTRRLAERLLKEYRPTDGDVFALLCQNATGDEWWWRVHESCQTLIMTPRVAYLDPTDAGRSQPRQGSMLLLWDSDRVQHGKISAYRWSRM